jgi:hypothetical protein
MIKWRFALSAFINHLDLLVSIPDHHFQQETYQAKWHWQNGSLKTQERFEAGTCRYQQRNRTQHARSTTPSTSLHQRVHQLNREMHAAIETLREWDGAQIKLTGLIRLHRVNHLRCHRYAGFWGTMELAGKPTAHFGAPLGERLTFRRGPWETWPSLLPVLDQPNPDLPMVFSPYCAGLLHEAIGHALEADYLQASPFKHKLGDTLTAAPLTIEDQPDLRFGAGSMIVDDAGNPATRTTLVQQGILVGTLEEQNGVLRRERYRDSLQQRASNFIIRNGSEDPSQWLDVLPDALYISWIQSGNWRPGTQRIKVLTGPVYRVRGGQATHVTPWSQLSFSITSLLQRMTALGDDGKRDPITHYCVKGHQRVPMSLVSPSILLRGSQ